MNKEKKPWPTKAVMEQIYEKNLWGGEPGELYSGEGSHLPELTEPYIRAIKSFLDAFEEPLSVCDLGCGDFNIGRHLFPFTLKYIGIDIVDSLIQRCNETFKAPNLEFYSLDIAKDQLPLADCAILRQVLQHLSNTEVQSVVDQLGQYNYVILTEHLPIREFTPNTDIISGQGIRLKKNSGLDLLSEPFNLQVKSKKLLLEQPLENRKGRLVTRVYEMNSLSER